MKTRVLWVGRTKNANLSAVCQDMADRIRRLTSFDITELREPKVADDRKRVEDESRRLLHNLAPSDYVVALDERGRSFDSNAFANFIGRHQASNPKDLVFVVGGPAGLSDAIRDRAEKTWSLSELTFSHDLARAVLMEQVYRAFSIIHNLPYAR